MYKNKHSCKEMRKIEERQIRDEIIHLNEMLKLKDLEIAELKDNIRRRKNLTDLLLMGFDPKKPFDRFEGTSEEILKQLDAYDQSARYVIALRKKDD